MHLFIYVYTYVTTTQIKIDNISITPEGHAPSQTVLLGTPHLTFTTFD